MIKKNILKYILITLFLILSFTNIAFSQAHKLCNGKEFNRRVKTLVAGGDVVNENTITRFERGFSPPSDEDYWVDISEDNDESVIAYCRKQNPNSENNKEKILYWYSTDNVEMNENSAFMFQGFTALKYIDLRPFSFFEGLDDTRYMFANCINLRSLQLRATGINPQNHQDVFEPTEMQGMFYSCQSLREIDLTDFHTYLVTNMDELFCKCYNLSNIYVDKNLWDISNVKSFNRMFSECHLLRSTNGRKAVDVADDDFEYFAGAAINGKESFIKDTNSTYTNYTEDLASVPIDGGGYESYLSLPEGIEEYDEEPEGNVGDENGAGGSNGNANGENSTATQMLQLDQNTANNVENQNTNQQSNNTINEQNTNVAETNSISINESQNETVESIEIDNNTENVNNNVENTENQTPNRRVVEIDDLQQGNKSKKSEENIIDTLFEDYQVLIVALGVAIFIIFILIGMVMYFFKEKNDNNGDKNKI